MIVSDSDIDQLSTRILFDELKELQSYLRLPEANKTDAKVAEVASRMRAVKSELTRRDAFKPKTGFPNVPSGEQHGRAVLKQGAPPTLEELEAELSLLENSTENSERIEILKKAIQSRI